MSTPTPQPPTGGIPAITGDIDYSRAIDVLPQSLKGSRSTILAYGASFISTTIGFPMDTIKTRMQTHKQFTSYFDCAAKTFKHEGIRGFFRGIWAPLISTSFSKSLSVSIFTQVKPWCYNQLFTDDSDTHPFFKNIPVCFLAGFIAGGGVSLFATPFEFTKVFSQIAKIVEKDKSLKRAGSSSTLATFRKIIKYEGLPGLYSGFRYHFLRDSLSSGIYFSIYESLKYSINTLMNADAGKNSQFGILMAGGFSGITCWALVFPIDTTKSLIQKSVVKNIFRKRDGLEPKPFVVPRLSFKSEMYRGLGISVTRSFMVNMVFFSTFEFLMAHII